MNTIEEDSFTTDFSTKCQSEYFRIRFSTLGLVFLREVKSLKESVHVRHLGFASCLASTPARRSGFTLVRNAGFTLVELLVVIAIVAILAAVVVLIINPLELTKRGRDAARLTDLASLQSAINIAVQDSTGSGVVAILCQATGAYPCSGQSHVDSRASNGTGWVKSDLGSQRSVSLPTLPIDPTQSTTFHYTYCADNDAWEINAVLESDQQKGRMTTDGGNESDKYEVGSNLTLIAAAGGSCTY